MPKRHMPELASSIQQICPRRRGENSDSTSAVLSTWYHIVLTVLSMVSTWYHIVLTVLSPSSVSAAAPPAPCRDSVQRDREGSGLFVLLPGWGVRPVTPGYFSFPVSLLGRAVNCVTVSHCHSVTVVTPSYQSGHVEWLCHCVTECDVPLQHHTLLCHDGHLSWLKHPGENTTE